MRTLFASVFIVSSAALFAGSHPMTQQTPAAPTTTQEELRAYEAFRTWITSQPTEVQRAADDDVYKRYASVLKAQGKSEKEAAATIQMLRSIGDRAEVERWNRILTSPKPMFNTGPNAFLAEVIKGVTPGRALDVGMGQGRNTVYLAQQGWDATGFDPADRAVAAAQEQAAKLGVKITTRVARAEDFDWGDSTWDLIVLCYVGAREYIGTVQRALRSGGMVVVEGFHRDATKNGPIGGRIVFETNELPTVFTGLRVVRYEDTAAVADFGLSETRVVRLAAVKP